MTVLGVMLWQITLAGMKYRTHPTETTVLYHTETTLTFPAVTICNLNPIRLSSVYTHDAASDIREYLDQVSICNTFKGFVLKEI